MTDAAKEQAVVVAPVTRRVSDVVWQALIAGAVTVILASIQVFSVIQAAQVRDTLKDSTEKAIEDRTQIKATVDENLIVSKQSHALANSAMLAQKKMLAEVTKAKAEITKDQADITAARVAEEAYREHLEDQKKQDAKK